VGPNISYLILCLKDLIDLFCFLQSCFRGAAEEETGRYRLRKQ